MKPLIRGQSLRLQAAEDVRQPKWNRLFPGDTEMHRSDFPGGSIKFDSEFFASLLDNWNRLGRPELPVDYFHDGEAVPDGLPLERKVAAGWITDMRTTSGGLEVLIRWTEKAAGFIERDELAFLSPTFAVDAPDKFEGGMQGPTLYGAGLLNTPFLQQLPRVAASAVPPTTAPAANNPKEKHMALNVKAICALLGVPDDSEEGAIMEALAKKCTTPAPAAAPPAPEAPPPAMAALSAQAEKLELDNGTLKTSLAAAVKRVEELELARKTEQLNALVAEVVAADKVDPDKTDTVVKMASAIGIEDTRKFFSAMPTRGTKTSEKGIGSADEVTPEKAVEARTAELVKTGLSRGEAMRRALLDNPAALTTKASA